MASFRKFRKFFAEAQMELESKPEVYRKVSRLKLALDYEINKNNLPPDVANAARQFRAKLIDASKSFDKKTDKQVSILVYREAVVEFATQCHSAIFIYQPILISAPDLWNQLKAHINNFMEYYAMAPLFNTDKSELGLRQNFSQPFNDVKSELIPEPDENLWYSSP